jgi:hypothetical protein
MRESPAKHAGKIQNELNMLAYALCQHCPYVLKGLSQNIDFLLNTFTIKAAFCTFFVSSDVFKNVFFCCFVLEKQEYSC